MGVCRGELSPKYIRADDDIVQIGAAFRHGLRDFRSHILKGGFQISPAIATQYMRMIYMHGGGEIIGYLPMLGAGKRVLWQHMRGDIFQDRRRLGQYATLSDQSRNAAL